MQASLCIWGNSNTNRKGRNIGAGNRLKEYNGTEYTHDPLGNLIYRELPNGEKQYFQYDTENQLTRAEIKKPQGNTEIWEYAYDPFGRRLSKERKDKLAWVSTAPKRTHFVWDGSRLLQEYTYKGNYTYIYTDQDSYEPLAQVFYNRKDDKQYLSYYHTDQIGIPREMTDQFGNLLWFGEYTAWGCLKEQTKVYPNAHQPFRLQNQYFDSETGLHYNFLRYYEPTTGRFINQDPIGLEGGANLYFFAPNASGWIDFLGLSGVDINLFSPNENIHSYAQRVANKPNVFQIGGHGNSSIVQDANGRNLNARDLANLVRSNPNYKEGMTVELLSCNTGKGDNSIAQQLSNELNTTVKAPTQYLWYYSDGKLVPMGMNPDGTQNRSQRGVMRSFSPQNNTSPTQRGSNKSSKKSKCKKC